METYNPQIAGTDSSVSSDPSHEVLTINEVQKHYFQGKISKDKLYSEVRMGKIPHLRVGSKILFRRTTLDSWFKDREINSLKR
ncbi:hypothetical protein PTI45_02052 [Paenibacillus nuruki]|uniref:Helix-turn-helix domain-containing protein n=1 Tax=Paenibacillus nuruki TaxID=1886670 RepID=A0A1E3L3W6_9BACL|nr:helix-turn-helix domain-containing protein [Paenibacillus nuruki]ODP28507.1 hypothetical protein PTI45_02052 [Paenibacillus nuruki]